MFAAVVDWAQELRISWSARRHELSSSTLPQCRYRCRAIGGVGMCLQSRIRVSYGNYTVCSNGDALRPTVVSVSSLAEQGGFHPRKEHTLSLTAHGVKNVRAHLSPFCVGWMKWTHNTDVFSNCCCDSGSETIERVVFFGEIWYLKCI
jgi:hypothetical protein